MVQELRAKDFDEDLHHRPEALVHPWVLPVEHDDKRVDGAQLLQLRHHRRHVLRISAQGVAQAWCVHQREASTANGLGPSRLNYTGEVSAAVYAVARSKRILRVAQSVARRTLAGAG